jgi:hypothetical protein
LKKCCFSCWLKHTFCCENELSFSSGKEQDWWCLTVVWFVRFSKEGFHQRKSFSLSLSLVLAHIYLLTHKYAYTLWSTRTHSLAFLSLAHTHTHTHTHTLSLLFTKSSYTVKMTFYLCFRACVSVTNITNSLFLSLFPPLCNCTWKNVFPPSWGNQ